MITELTFDENLLLDKYPFVFNIILFDHSSNKNILWCTDIYKHLGYKFSDEINEDVVINKHIIKPRSLKSREEQVFRAQTNGEVFTPSWMCNLQNNTYDNDWFGRENVFNSAKNKKWVVNKSKIEFPNGKSFADYIKSCRIEITCGEAPYIVSRYDTVSGKQIPLFSRIGLLDRKFRVIHENASRDNWLTFAITAIKSTYAFEWQGDNLLLARENVLLSFIEYYANEFEELPDNNLVKEVANIISWNIWQMDGLKFVIPCSCVCSRITNYDLFGNEVVDEIECPGCINNNPRAHTGVYCKIMDWELEKEIKYLDLVKGI